jgi:hypothetical protein
MRACGGIQLPGYNPDTVKLARYGKQGVLDTSAILFQRPRNSAVFFMRRLRTWQVDQVQS